ncbi:hypothetical protein MVEN_02448400 [Mycena venus]|uniref:Uncharacterized protein n=1 Tax=Mycena venus TaxID=2733690 RepID=A0A8H6WZ16_9AGAR|nr:hypothetical protein MVEN_02448400 [Mycena venus]
MLFVHLIRRVLLSFSVLPAIWKGEHDQLAMSMANCWWSGTQTVRRIAGIRSRTLNCTIPADWYMDLNSPCGVAARPNDIILPIFHVADSSLQFPAIAPRRPLALEVSFPAYDPSRMFSPISRLVPVSPTLERCSALLPLHSLILSPISLLLTRQTHRVEEFLHEAVPLKPRSDSTPYGDRLGAVLFGSVAIIGVLLFIAAFSFPYWAIDEGDKSEVFAQPMQEFVIPLLVVLAGPPVNSPRAPLAMATPVLPVQLHAPRKRACCGFSTAG